MILLLDIFGAIFGIIGAIMTGRKRSIGYIFFMGCNIAYGILGLVQGYYGLLIVSIVMFIIDVIYYKKWRTDELSK